MHAPAAVGGPLGKVVSYPLVNSRHYVPEFWMGPQLPTVSRPLDESHGQNSLAGTHHDNDVDPDFWESLAQQVGSFAPEPLEAYDAFQNQVTTTSPPEWNDCIPPCNPFLFPQLTLAHLFWLLGYTCRNSIFAGKKSLLLLLTAFPALPICGHRSENVLRDRSFRSKIHFDPMGRRTLGKLSLILIGPTLWGLSLLSSRLIWAWFSVPQPTGNKIFPLGTLSFLIPSPE